MTRPLRTLASLLLLALLTSLAGCSGSGGDGAEPLPGQQLGDKQPVRPQEHLVRARQSFMESRLIECEAQLRAVLKEHPDHVEANRVLALLLNTLGRRWEAGHCSFKLLQLGQFTIQDLIMLATPQETFSYEDLPLVEMALTTFPDEPRPATGLVRAYRRDNRYEPLLDFLKRIVAQHPGYVEAQAQLGLLLLEMKRPDDFVHWYTELPNSARRHPLIWLALANWANEMDQLPAAARCYWETVRRAPNHRAAHSNLGIVLNRLDRTSESDRFRRRSQQLANLEEVVFPLFKEGPNVDAVRKAAMLTESLGRLWEAWGWNVALLSIQPGDEQAMKDRDRLRNILDRDRPPQVLVSARPDQAIDLSDHPLPRLSTPDGVRSDVAAGQLRVDFPDVAQDAGIAFRYFDSWVAADRELMLLETIGGGVAILDYDNDGWPDIYFTQCCEWPVDLENDALLDRLYRNRGNGRFEDVTAQAGIRENGYSQGVTAGDFDNDGFIDLYVANVGQNRLWHNNGDGTFSRVPHHQDDRVIWTASTVMADLNGDTWPDIFDANYLVGDELYTKHCMVDGHLRSCGPTLFDGEQDALYLNMGDGRWQEVSQQAGLDQLTGMGLGVVAADFDGSGQLQLFVSNDVMANFFLINESTTPGSVPRYMDAGTLTGTAFDRNGRSQASMGIACDDVDGDGLLDLLLGNYYNDCNTLYIQQVGQLFSDETRRYNLRDPSFLLLTFGAQFLDGDLDGFADFTIANGHVDDFRFRGEPWHMRPQYFHNENGERFVEIPAERAGDYYQQDYLGRGVAVVDWNRDGREEFVVSNIADYASLTLNRTSETGHFLAIRLRGIESPRDPIGTQVTVEWGQRRRTRQLVGGNGFEASNQKQLVFGLGSAQQVDQLRVTWPSGRQQQFENVPADREYLLVEGDERIHEVPRDEPLEAAAEE